jgi:hypothetical protein
MIEFTTKVAGIPCICRVTNFTDVISANLDGDPDNWTPEEGGEFEYDILDKKGYKAKWLEKKLTKEDDERLYSEFKLECRSEEFNEPF